MSLINCPECNNNVSNKAESCPNCAYPINTKSKEGCFLQTLNNGCAAIAAIIILLILVGIFG